MQFNEEAREAMRQEMQVQAEAAQEVAKAQIAAQWVTLEAALPATEPRDAPVLTLYRDANGWCPFCERVWLQLEQKGLPYEEVLISLKDKPAWYLEMVPTGLVPAVKIESSGEVLWESADIMRRIEADFSSDAAPPLLPVADSAERARAEEMMEGSAALGKAGFQVAMSARNESLGEPERAALRASFEAALRHLDAQIAAGGGPFMLGADFSLVDCTYAPLLERWAVQLPLTMGFDLRPPQPDATPRWPALEGWFVSMAALPSYATRVLGDNYSWSAAVGTFQRMFSANSSAPLSEQARAVTVKADYAAALALRASVADLATADAAGGDAATRAAARSEAAAVLIRNRAAIVADATNQEPKSQPQLRRLEEREAPLVESILQTATEKLLGPQLGTDRGDGDGDGGGDDDEAISGREMLEEMLDEDWTEAEIASIRGRSARYVAARLCVPRDMGAAAGAVLRATLLEIADHEERFAWSASGGML